MGNVDTGIRNGYVSTADVVPRCPLCHTSNAAMTAAELLGGAYWRCSRCGQMWDAARLQAAALYSRYAGSH